MLIDVNYLQRWGQQIIQTIFILKNLIMKIVGNYKRLKGVKKF
jgi:hypothetical protein